MAAAVREGGRRLRGTKYNCGMMSGGVCGAWGGSAAAPMRLQDVMDAELASRLQREEQAQWEREIAGRFGSGCGAGWCFVEVPSAGGGAMSVVQQEITAGDEAEGDADYALALELEAQEAEEYDRLLRQQESSMERVRAIQEGDRDVRDLTETPTVYYTSDGQLVVDEQSEEDEEEDSKWIRPMPKRRRHGNAPKQWGGFKQHVKEKGKRSRRHTAIS